MTRNGASAPPAPVEDHRPEAEFSEPVEETTEIEPQMSVQSMDYWREMTMRQVARLTAEIKAIEAEYDAKLRPLRRDLTVLQAALSGIKTGSAKVSAAGASSDLSEHQRELIKQLVVLGKDTSEIRAAMPEVRPSLVYSAIYTARQNQIKEAKPR